MLHQGDPRLEYCRWKTLKIKGISAGEMGERHSSEERNGDADRLEVLNGRSKRASPHLEISSIRIPGTHPATRMLRFYGSLATDHTKTLSAQQLPPHRLGPRAQTQMRQLPPRFHRT